MFVTANAHWFVNMTPKLRSSYWVLAFAASARFVTASSSTWHEKRPVPLEPPELAEYLTSDIEPEELDGYFPELRDLVKHCYYSDCTHDETEVGCAVHKAVEEGSVSRDRYESYLRIRFGDEEES